MDPPTPECVKKYPTAKHMCMFVENFYQEITIPYFIIQSLYDSWSTRYILNIGCDRRSSGSLEQCSDEERV